MKITLRYKGGTGSGNYGHAGRPGKVGGSSKGSTTGLEVSSSPRLDKPMSYIVSSDGKWYSKDESGMFHTMLYAMYVVDHPEEYQDYEGQNLQIVASRILGMRIQENSEFEDAVQARSNMFSVQYVPADHKGKSYIVVKVSPNSSNDIMAQAFKRFQRLYRQGKIDLSKIDALYFNSWKLLTVEPASDIDNIAGLDSRGNLRYKHIVKKT